MKNQKKKKEREKTKLQNKLQHTEPIYLFANRMREQEMDTAGEEGKRGRGKELVNYFDGICIKQMCNLDKRRIVVQLKV